MTIEKTSAWRPLLDEDVVDYGIGTAEQQAAAARRIEEREAASRARWMALPWWERARRRIWYSRWRYEVPHRLAVALDVLRGRHECD